MAVVVVDGLEAVQVDHEQGSSVLAVLQLLDPVAQHQAIGQVCQRVTIREMEQPLLACLVLGHVAQDGAEVHAALVLPHGQRQLDREFMPVGMLRRQFDEMADQPRRASGGDALQATSMTVAQAVRNDQVEAAPNCFCRSVAEQPLCGGVPEGDPVLAAGADDAVWRGGGDVLEADLADLASSPQPAQLELVERHVRQPGQALTLHIGKISARLDVNQA